jgi:serine/threonine-protein kinase RsbT
MASAGKLASMLQDDVRIVVPLRLPDDIVRARQSGRDIARTLGFGMADQTRLATAISEITRNAIHYGGGGECEIVAGHWGRTREITVTIRDQGPGIPDVERAMTPGFSTGNSLGMGLSGTKQLVDTLVIESAPGRTHVVMVMRRSGLR